MKHFTCFNILFCVLVLIFFVQVADAEQIYIPGTAYGGIQYTAQQSGMYTFTYSSGAVRGPDCGDEIWCGCCPAGQACWSGIVEIYVNRAISWDPIFSWCPVVPLNPDYSLGTEHFWTIADAETVLKGTSVAISLHKGDTLNITLRDFETSYGDNTGGVTLDVSFSPCKVDVRTKELPFPVNNFYHSYIIYTDSDEKEWLFRGGSAHFPFPWGALTTYSGEYKEGSLDWTTNYQSKTVLEGEEACNKDVCFKSVLQRISNENWDYYPVPGPNSNTVAYTLLDECGLEIDNPVTNKIQIPGWHRFTDVFLIFKTTCPVDISVVDSKGNNVNKVSSQISDALYFETDLDFDNDLDDLISIPDPGHSEEYEISVVPEPDAEPTDTFTLSVEVNGKPVVLAQDVMIQDIPNTPYHFIYKNIVPLPGYTNPPTDPDNDGIYEDLNANGRLDFADIVLCFTQMQWIGANEPIAAFDLNGNGRIDFADIVALFNEI